MLIFGKILIKLMPQKLIRKIVGKQLNKAIKVDCGIFVQAAKRNKAQGPITDFINTHSATEVSLEELLKQSKAANGGSLTSYKDGSKTTEQLLLGGLHQNVEFGTSISKDLLG